MDQYKEKCSDKDLEKCEFIRMCLNQDPSCRPDAKTLSRHPSLFTISQLRILSAHAVHDYRDIYPREGQFSLDTKLKNIKRDDDEDKVKNQPSRSISLRTCTAQDSSPGEDSSHAEKQV